LGLGTRLEIRVGVEKYEGRVETGEEEYTALSTQTKHTAQDHLLYE
jgi:hypothetical protein